MVGKLNDKNDPNFGFDAQSGEYVDMVKGGIIDPTKVVRVALQDAASVAGLLITTEAMVGDKPEPKGAAGMPPGAWVEWAAWITELSAALTHVERAIASLKTSER